MFGVWLVIATPISFWIGRRVAAFIKVKTGEQLTLGGIHFGVASFGPLRVPQWLVWISRPEPDPVVERARKRLIRAAALGASGLIVAGIASTFVADLLAALAVPSAWISASFFAEFALVGGYETARGERRWLPISAAAAFLAMGTLLTFITLLDG